MAQKYPLTSEELEAKVEAWHNGAGTDQELHVWLGMTWEQYKHWAETGEINTL